MKAALSQPTWGVIPRLYLVLALVAVMALSALPYSAIAVVLFLLQIYLLWRRPNPKISLPLDLLCLAAFPLAFEPVIPQPLAAFLVLPAIPLLDGELRANAQAQPFASFSKGRRPSIVLKGMAMFLAVVLFVSLIAASYTMSLTAALLTAYMLGISLYAIRRFTMPIHSEETPYVKVITGESRALSAVLRNRSGMPLRLRLLSTYPWVSLEASEVTIAETLRIEASVTPPLAGPTRLPIQASILDPWGMIQVNQVLELAVLTVVPRARYASWLARKYLEGEGRTFRGPMVSPSLALLSRHRGHGAEYDSSHPYSPGDRFKDMDWKHSARLRQLIVKRYSDVAARTALIVVNLAVEDAEEADRLAWSLVTSVMTLAANSIPTALAAYNQQEVVAVTPITAPKIMLNKVLQLIENTVLVQPTVRFLQPPDLKRLSRTLDRLEGVGSEPAQRLAAVLGLEKEAARRATEQHPISLALKESLPYVYPPAMILVFSPYNHDAEVLPVTLATLKDRGYTVLPGYAKEQAALSSANSVL